LAHVTQTLAFSADGTFLAVGGDQGISLWEIASGKESRLRRQMAADIAALTFLPGGNVLATNWGDGTVLTWDVRRLQALARQ
jgi:WD40 repeat protein